nr:uncharacterized protein LOC127297146 isoform X4 [Lolium perenne]
MKLVFLKVLAMVLTSIEPLPTSTEQSLLLLGPLSRSSPTRVYIKKVVRERGEFCRRVHHGMEARTRGLLAMAYVYLSWVPDANKAAPVFSPVQLIGYVGDAECTVQFISLSPRQWFTLKVWFGWREIPTLVVTTANNGAGGFSGCLCYLAEHWLRKHLERKDCVGERMLVARMGILFSCPADCYDPMEEGILEPSASSGGLRALDSSKLLIQGSLSFKRAQLDDNYPSSLQVETEISIKTADIAAIAPDSSPATVVPLVQRALARVMYTDGGLGRGEPKARGGGDEAAEGVQELSAAAAAVLAEQNWWKLLDFALLKRSSVSFNIEKQETAVFKWLRVRAPAAKRHEAGSQDEEREEERWLRKAAYIFHGCLYIFYVSFSLIVEEEVASMWRLGELKWSSTCLYASQHPIKLRNLSCVLSEFSTESRDLCENESTNLKNCQRPLVVGGRVHRAIIMVLGS